jgi:hypothetical protein
MDDTKKVSAINTETRISKLQEILLKKREEARDLRESEQIKSTVLNHVSSNKSDIKDNVDPAYTVELSKKAIYNQLVKEKEKNN